MKGRERISITVDTREQTPLQFDPERAEVVVGTVPVFDYALTGDEANFAIERKSLGDFVSSMLTPDNFRRELSKLLRARAAGMPSLHYVIEARFTDLFCARTYRMFDDPASGARRMSQQWRHMTLVERVNVIFACDAEHAARAVYGLLKIRSEYLKENV